MLRTTAPPTQTVPPTVLDLRERPLEDLRAAYEERWQLIADATGAHPADEALARNAARITALEQRCRPAARRLPRRAGPDPATFLG
ncbi:hypothetical protein [Kineococcus sp. SYSU DK003]|uniref:hypothetical protein n=1 Tax=Kineococcus sp. SYSU DK003 TaxID=3383124 RepID=UPI003D7F0B26